MQPEFIQETLEHLRQTIRDAAPEAEELISYSMPAFKLNGMLCWFHTYKNHYAIYVRPHVMEPFLERLKPYITAKSAIQFPIKASFPVELITEIVEYAVKCNADASLSQNKKGKKRDT